MSLMFCLAIFAHVAIAAGQTSSAEQLRRIRGAIVRVAIVVPPGTKITGNLAPYFSGNVLIVGTGSFVNNTGAVITAAHVVNDAKRKLDQLRADGITAFLEIGYSIPNVDTPQMEVMMGSTYIDCIVDAIDNNYDLALLRMLLNPFTIRLPRLQVPGIPAAHTSELTSVKFSVARPKETDQVFACGFPSNSPNLITSRGAIASAWKLEVPLEAAKRGGKQNIEIYQADLRINPGESGGPVFRVKDGAVIGIVIEYSGNGIANIVPAKYITAFLTKFGANWQLSDQFLPGAKGIVEK